MMDPPNTVVIVAEKIEGYEKLNHSWPHQEKRERKPMTLSEVLKPKQSTKSVNKTNYWDDQMHKIVPKTVD
jgi:hypothetical protein